MGLKIEVRMVGKKGFMKEGLQSGWLVFLLGFCKVCPKNRWDNN
jgi:hypothetical protein